ncbi:MAG: hypothetical protein V3W34_18155 [Phycisphaerae bacterium]
MEEFAIQTSVRDLAFILFKRKWSVVVILVATFVSAVVWIFLIRGELYQVTAKVLVRIGHEQAVPATTLGDRPLQIIGQRFQDVNSEGDILYSVDLLGRVVDELGLDKPGPPPPVPEKLIARLRFYAKALVKGIKSWYHELMIKAGLRPRLTAREGAIAMLQKGLLVRPQKDSNIIVVSLFLPTRQYGSFMLNHLLKVYLDFRLEVLEDRSAVDFFQSRVDQSSAELTQAEHDLQAFEERWDIRALEQQKKIFLEQIAAARSSLTAGRIEFREASSKLARLERELQSDEPDFAVLGGFDPNSFPAKVMLELSRLQREREQLRMTELDDSVRIRNNRDQFRVHVGEIASHLRSDLLEKEEVYGARQAEFDALQGELGAVHGKEMEWRVLKRRATTLEMTDMFYRSKLEDASARAALDSRRIGNVVVVEHAIDAFKPSGMRKVMLLGISAVVAVLAALSWVAVAEFFDHAIYSAEALENRLSVSVVAVIPRVRRRWFGRGAGEGVLLARRR